MLTLDDRMMPAPGVVTRENDGELIVVIPQRGRFIVLNGTGANIFKLLDGRMTLAQVARHLAETYNVPLERTQQDVLNFATNLYQRGALQMVPLAA